MKKQIKAKGWIALTHGKFGSKDDLYIQRTKPKVRAWCGCETVVVPCTITYSLPKKPKQIRK